MASDQHMIETLTELLQDGETLMYPIFGTIKHGPFQLFAYFAFTETHFLIAYLTSKDIVTDVERIPLDIKSVKVKKTKLLNEYKLHVLFENNLTQESIINIKDVRNIIMDIQGDIAEMKDDVFEEIEDDKQKEIIMRLEKIKKSTNFFKSKFEKICGLCGQLFSEESFSHFYNISGSHSYQQVALCTIF